MGKHIDLVGQKFGHLTVIRLSDKRKYGRVTWHCKCDCGEYDDFTTGSLKSTNRLYLKSCRNCAYKMNNVTHGMCGTPEYIAWLGLKKRCRAKNWKRYDDYGGRGITVCSEWVNSFENFFADMGLRPSSEHSIDRINNDKGYSADNCRWATLQKQAENRRNMRRFEGTSLDGGVIIAKNMTEFARSYDLCVTGICNVLASRRDSHKGWRFEYI